MHGAWIQNYFFFLRKRSDRGCCLEHCEVVTDDLPSLEPYNEMRESLPLRCIDLPDR